MSTPGSCNVGESKSKSDDVCEVNDMLYNMSTTDNDSVSIICANCGKEGASNICNKCKQVTYCNAACKKKHRHKHKKDCEEHVRLAAELHDIELFKQPPSQYGDCPICFVRLPTFDDGTIRGRSYNSCCGKMMCCGCLHAPLYDNQGNKVDHEKCPFCRTPPPFSKEEIVKREKIRVEAGDAAAIYNLGIYYAEGDYGFPQDMDKALELWHRAGKLGYATAYHNIGYPYDLGIGMDIDKEKAEHYWELAAIMGEGRARHNLGVNEERRGNMDRALKHYMIAARNGYSDSLKQIQILYTNRCAKKEDYMKALQLYQAYLKEIKSVQRDKAAADREDYRYY